MSEMNTIVRDFVAEATDNLDRIEEDLVKLEKDPGCRPLLIGIFRTVHSLKGATGFLGFTRLRAVAHAAEGVLSRVRDGVLVMDPEITDGLLSMVDTIRRALPEIEQTGKEGAVDYSSLIADLTALQEKALPVSRTK